MRILALILLMGVFLYAEKISVTPNPLSSIEGEVAISYVLPDTAIDKVYYEIYDVFGNLVLKKEFSAGEEGARSGTLNTVFWNGINGRGERVATGVYTVYIRAYQGNRLIFRGRERIGVVW